MKMDANLLIGMDSSLASQCPAFCQALANQGKDFSFSLTINSTFSFSLDTRESNVKSTLAKKRSSHYPTEECKKERGVSAKETQLWISFYFWFEFTSRPLFRFNTCGSCNNNILLLRCCLQCSIAYILLTTTILYSNSEGS